MGRIFNVSGACDPDIHYMVDISGRLREIREMVDAGQYFTINCARQYGKTTTLEALGRFLREDYAVVNLDFQREMSDAKFKNENVFSVAFARAFIWEMRQNTPDMPASLGEVLEGLEEQVKTSKNELELVELFRELSHVCKMSEKPIVLMVDEIDSATNNQVFLDFLSQLRGYYIARKRIPTFRSVILAGVYDVRNIKYKIRKDDEQKINSPWNIAADFLVDMSFSEKEIAGMLREYEADYGAGMNIEEAASLIYDYTSGYPFLVSRICKLADERIQGSGAYPDRRSAWTKEGLLEAVKILLAEKNSLFESLAGKWAEYAELWKLIYSLLFTGNEIPYSPLIQSIAVAEMLGFVKNSGGRVVISNRIFETILYNLFLAEESLDSAIYKSALQDKNQFVKNGRLDMDLVLERFVVHFDDLYGGREDGFLEDAGRRYFLLYLKPIINGTGNYYIEAQTRNGERTDVVVDYRGEQFVIELKLWRGNAYNERGEAQLLEYLDYYHLKKGYMLSFNFNKKKQIGVKEVRIGDRLIVEAVV